MQAPSISTFNCQKETLQIIELPIMIGILWSVHNTHTHTHTRRKLHAMMTLTPNNPTIKQPPIQRPFDKHDSWQLLLLFSRRGGEFLNGIHLQVDRSIARTCRHMDPHSNYYVQSWIFMGFVEAQLSSAQLSSARSIAPRGL